MDKNELEAHRLSLAAQKFHIGMTGAAHIVTAACVLFAIWIIMDGLKSIVLAKPDAIQALAVVIEKLRVNDILGWIVGAIGVGGWFYERKGKQRAIRKLATERKQKEANDTHHSSSQLDRNGHTPKS